ncbi:hypothetical protein [Bradyrhizobium sp. Ai1a-2]|nr:hypothetical protein [Bradyrhizobium sp. Ai1a-2]
MSRPNGPATRRGHSYVDGEYVLPSDEIDEGDGLDIIHEYNPHDERPAH